MAIHSASAQWHGDLVRGRGTVSAASGPFHELPVSWGQRTEAEGSGTSPEELLAAAHAACFCMAFSGGLAKNGTPPERLSVVVTVSFERTDGLYAVASSAIDVRGWVDNIDPETFSRLAQEAKEGCPISRALGGNVRLSVEASLAG